ncbi:MAG: endolytic transglycosylase MltG [Lachnospiraceae bacterium]|nr:endolytic transglycosylase MltG [Lachnospiraceae bacterium]
MSKSKIIGLIAYVVDLILKVVIAIFVIHLIITWAGKCYDYGYRIFTEPPISVGEGREVSVTIPEKFSAKQLGTIFAEKGLSRDATLFMLQYYASEYRKDLKPGTYTVSTSMTAEEMFAAMTAKTTVEGDDGMSVLPDAGEATGTGEEEEAPAAPDGEEDGGAGDADGGNDSESN